MRARIETLLGMPSAPLWIGTFHGIAHRLLRLHWREAGLPQGFPILDGEDQQRLVKRMIRGLELDETRWVPREVTWFINAQKDEGLRPKHLKDDGDPTRQQMIKLYEEYEEACRRNGVVDFAELLLRSFELLRDNTGARRALPRALRARAGGRVPGHQHHPVLVDEGARRRDQQPVRRRRRRPVDLPLARRAGREPAAVPPRLPGRADCSGSSRTTAPPAPSSPRPTRSSPTTPAASARSCGPTAARASRSGSTARTTSATRPSSCCTGSATGPRAAATAATRRCCTARTRSRACSRSTCSRRACRTASTAACGSSSAPRSRTRSPTCGSSPTATTTPPSSAS